MRTLQEKYNAIQEGKFSKEHFLTEARMQQPQLITRFNGYDDAVQILKNRGMIVEVKVEEAGGHAPINNLSKFHGITGDKLPEDREGLEKALKAAEEGGNKRTAQEIRIALKKLNEARLTKNNLTDYRYKPTNEMDKYPYEQILRGLRVELETMGIPGTPTAEEYAKALAKVSKNLAKDSIFYTNQLAGVNPKVDLHDKMVDATAKNTVDTFNGMKKATLKEGIKNLIKKALMENEEDVYEMYADEEDEIDYDDENFSDPMIDGEDLFESQDMNIVRNLMTMYETKPSEFERLHKQAEVQATTTQHAPTRVKFKHILSLFDRAKAGALQSLANQDNFEADREGMDESVSLKDLL